MVPIVGGAKMPVGNVRVDLRRRDVAMAQQRLHRTRVCAALQQMGRKAVAQSMWRNFLQARVARMGLDNLPRHLPRQRSSTIQKKLRFVLLAKACALAHVPLQPMNCALADRDAPLLAALALTNDQATMHVHIRNLQ